VPVAYPVFRAALDGGDLRLVIELARDMPPMRLDDALRVLLLMRDQSDARYETACVRWLGRFALEGKGTSVEDVQEAADLVASLRGEGLTAAEELLSLCRARGLTRA
jgi:hypothetical protein